MTIPASIRSDWRERAACLGRRDWGHLTTADQLAICHPTDGPSCPVAAECLHDYLTHASVTRQGTSGEVWGGLAPDQIHKMRRARSRRSAR